MIRGRFIRKTRSRVRKQKNSSLQSPLTSSAEARRHPARVATLYSLAILIRLLTNPCDRTDRSPRISLTCHSAKLRRVLAIRDTLVKLAGLPSFPPPRYSRPLCLTPTSNPVESRENFTILVRCGPSIPKVSTNPEIGVRARRRGGHGGGRGRA